MLKNLLNNSRILYTSDGFYWPFAPLTDLDIDVAYRVVGQGCEQDAKALNTRFSLCIHVVSPWLCNKSLSGHGVPASGLH